MIFKFFFSSNKSRLFVCSLYFFSFIISSFFTIKAFSEVVWQLPPEQRSSSGIDSTDQVIVTDATGANVAIIWRGGSTAVQAAISNDFGVNWTSSFNLSAAAGTFSGSEDITMSKSGQYIYGIWPRSPAGTFQIELSRSIDFGVSWTPIGSVKVLSTATVAVQPNVATDSSGQFVYASWQQTVGADNIITTSRSTDFGATWPAGASAIALSATGEDASSSEITTNGSGQYVYAIWQRVDGGTSKTRVQTSRSIDFGASWTLPGSVITLSADDQNATNQRIMTSTSGKYVYAVWEKIIDVGNTNIQFARSTDFGATFSSAVNIVSSIGKATKPEIAIDDTGQYVYLVYRVDTGGRILLSRSTDFGATFSSPITVSSGTANTNPAITTDKTGKNVYVIWDSTGSAKDASSSSDFGQTFSPPETLTGSDSFIIASITTDDSGRYVYAAFDVSPGDVIIHSIRALDQLLLTTPIIRVFRE
ncbi:MAG: hypothetical protein KR126chlam4_00295 [Candidatus Anoxychlamydiales bacterium]|uniref:Sialidase domain-containing protein n=1 Tax=marine sediment metagenome TaxID=412755 RepID=A0A0F9H3I2_9ZZZZ|nr:hypothetical protein [Candidatus Anoxychlamydiales bacterium]HEU64739.1 exo-alpha-sialidase [Chlamydiota bacterium]